jgi:mRNA interferase RelE/StbE
LAWTISYTDTARKQLRKLGKPTAGRILDFMDERIAARDAGKALTGPLLGTFRRYRVGDDRIICELQDGKLCVLVIEVGHRREIYR